MVEDLNRFQTLLENVAHRTLIATHKILPDVLSNSSDEKKSSFISHSCKVFWNFLSNVVSADIATVCAASNQGYAFSFVTKSFVQWRTLENRRQRNFHESRVKTTPVRCCCCCSCIDSSMTQKSLEHRYLPLLRWNRSALLLDLTVFADSSRFC